MITNIDAIQEMPMTNPIVSESQEKTASVPANNMFRESEGRVNSDSMLVPDGILLGKPIHETEMEFKTELQNSLLEPSRRVKKLQSALPSNSRSQLLINLHNDHKLGVWTAPKVHQIYILDVNKREELIQKAVEGVEFVAHHMFNQLLLRVCRKMKHMKCQKKIGVSSIGENVCERKEKARTVEAKKTTQIMEIKTQSQGYQEHL